MDSKDVSFANASAMIIIPFSMRGDHCQNSTLYRIIYSDHLITGLQVRQQTMRIYEQPSDMFK